MVAVLRGSLGGAMITDKLALFRLATGGVPPLNFFQKEV